MVTQLPLASKNWAVAVELDPGQVKIIIGYIRREIFWTFLGDQVKILVWNTEYVCKVPINNDPALVQVMAWCWIGDKPLFEPMLTQLTDTYMRH